MSSGTVNFAGEHPLKYQTGNVLKRANLESVKESGCISKSKPTGEFSSESIKMIFSPVHQSNPVQSSDCIDYLFLRVPSLHVLVFIQKTFVTCYIYNTPIHRCREGDCLGGSLNGELRDQLLKLTLTGFFEARKSNINFCCCINIHSYSLRRI